MPIKCSKCQFENPSDSKFCKECGTQLFSAKEISVSITKTLKTPIKRLTIGSLFAERYEILEELGKGGMGEVYKVKDEKLDEEMALKLLKPEIAADRGIIERFKNELKLARKIAHRNVCKMHDFHEEGETPYITMEYVEGEDLKSYIRKREKLTEKETISIAKQVCEGLAEAHGLGIVHRDLKPQNIMIDEKGQAKIMDFGIARSVEAPGVTQTGMMIGTPDYISPEQAEGEEADHRSDIYSLGVILYEMVTGSVPFRGDSALSVVLKHKAQLPQDPKKLNPDVSESMSRLILICMEKDRARRYQSAETLLVDLRNIEEGFPLGTKIRPRRETFVAVLIRKKLFIPALIISLVIIGVSIWRLMPQKGAVTLTSGKPSLAVMYFENRSNEPDLDKIIVDLLARNLSRYEDIEVVSSQRLFDILRQIGKQDTESIDKKVATEVANRAEVKTMLVGSIIEIGDTIRITSELTDVKTGSIIGSEEVEGSSINDAFEMADELTAKLGVRLDLSAGEKGPSLKVVDVSTNSLEAYNYFLRGKEEYEKLLTTEARKFLKKAVELDSTFAVAYLYLGFVVEGVDERNEAFERAMNFREKASDKERLFIEASYAYRIERDQEKRFGILRQMEKKYPDDKLVHFNLAEYYVWKKDQLHNAVEEYNKTLELDPSYSPALAALATIYMGGGEYEKSLEYNKKYASASPGDPNPLDSIGELYFNMGKLDEAIARYKEAIQVEPEWGSEQSIAYIYALREDYSEAIKWIDQYIVMAPSSGNKATGFLWKGFYYYWLGCPDRSLAEIYKAEEIGESLGRKDIRAYANWIKGWIYYDKNELELSRKHFKSWFDFYREPLPRYKAAYNFYLGLSDLKQGQIDSAKAKLDQMKLLLPQIFELHQAYTTFQYDLLSGEVLLAEDSLEKATSVFKETSIRTFRVNTPLFNYGSMTRYNAPFLNDVLARIYIKKREIDRAIAEYERLITFDPDSTNRRLIHPKYHYRLAQLYEQKGRKSRAVKHFEKFLDLWKDADPGIPEVEDARERLAGLKDKSPSNIQ